MTKRRLVALVRFAKSALQVVAGVLVALGIAWAQETTATFYGIVTDPSGAVIPGAQVTLIQTETRATTTKTTDSRGEFAFDFVPPGTYSLRIESRGFKSYESSGIELVASQQVRQTFALELGAVTQTVKVEGASPLVNIVSAQQLQTFESTAVEQLPLSRRNVSSILRVGTGVISSGDSVRMNGVGKNGSVFSVDGTQTSGNPEGRYASTYSQVNYIDLMSIEAIQEVHTVKSVLPAEFGDTVGGHVNLVTRSGTNTWHGSLFENYEGAALSARFQTLKTKPGLVFNQFGGSLGGPVKRDKMFIFGTYEGYRERAVRQVQGNVPTQKLRDEMLRAVPSYQLALVRVPLPNQPLKSPDADVGFYRDAKSQQHRDDHADAKMDILLTSNSRLSLSYSRGRPFFLLPSIAPNGINDRIWHNWLERGSVSFITGGANWTSETRWGVNTNNQTRQDEFLSVRDPNRPNEEFPFGRRIGGIDPVALGSNLGSFGIGRPELWRMEGVSWSVAESFSRHLGRHSFKFGGDFLHQCCMRIKQAGPTFRYTSKEDLLNNIPSQIDTTFGSNPFRGRMYEFGFFAQDDWRTTPKLVLNLGIRYDYYSNMVARGKNGLDAAFYNPDGLLDNEFHVGPLRGPNNPYENDGWVNLGPRLGFAYNPDGKGKTAIRGGFGVLFSSQILGAMWQSVGANGIPFRARFSRNDAVRLGLRWPMFNDDFRKIVTGQNQGTGQVSVFSIFDPHLQNPYAMHYTLGIERELTPTMMLETAFVGLRGVKFLMHRWANQPDRVTGLRPNPLLLVDYYVDESQVTDYASWQTSLRKRFSRGLSGSVHYTWGKSLSTAGGDIGAYYQGDADARTQDFFNPKADRGPSTGDITHYFVSEWVYELRVLPNLSNPVARHALGGWQVSGIFTARTGGPLYITQTSAIENSRPDYIGGRAVDPDYRQTLQYLNPAAFAKVPLGATSKATVRPGSVGNGGFRGPGAWSIDLGIAKNFSLDERLKLQVRSDMFNAFNHTNLAGLSTNINDQFFGQLLSTTGARVIQLNARLSW